VIFHNPARTSCDEALRLFYDTVDNQYGLPLNGRLQTPNARHELPGSWAEVPF
jgi:hypothetical protein